tara:strand:+ start:942 stop:1379 length:438 start_codon:yes stop_codon:yes gene_type:complete
MKIELEEIKKLLPHRKPFLFIDSCEIIENGKIGVGQRKFLPEEYFFKGHFPNKPIVPGVILIESLAQTAGVVVSKSLSYKENKTVLFTSISNAKFRKPVLPNDEIYFEVKFITQVKNIYKFSGVAKRKFEKVCEAVFSAIILNKK